jgi:Uma2 family endonuclease
MTAEDLLKHQGRCELLRGELIEMTPASANHGKIAMRIALALGNHVQSGKLGEVLAAETGFVLERNPDTVRAPDAAFVSSERAGGIGERGFFEGPPDLAVEVLSPDDTASEVNSKVQDWLSAGCRQVWVADPKTRTVTVHHPDGQAEVIPAEGRLTGGEILPGFELPVADIFAK